MDLKYVDKKGERTIRIRDEIAFAWVGMTDHSVVPLDMVIALRVVGDAADGVAVFERIFAAVMMQVEGRRRGDVDKAVARLFTRTDHAGVSISHGNLSGLDLYMSSIGSSLLLATTRDRITNMIDRRSGDTTSLAQDPRFKQAVSYNVGAGTVTTFFGVQVDRVFDAVAKIHPHAVPAVRAQFAQMGLGGFRGITSTGRVDGAGISATTTVHLDGKRVGLGRMFSAGPPAKLGTLRFAPKSTIYCAAGNFDLKEHWDTVIEVGGLAVTMGLEAPFKQKFELDLREDIINTIGPEGALIVASNRGLIPDVALALECRQPERLEKALLSMLRGVKWPEGTGISTLKLADGLRAYSLPLGHRRLADFPIAPTFGIVDGHLLITPYPMSFQRIVAVYRGESPRLSENPDFRKLKGRIPRNALGMSYLDLVRVLEIFYETAIPIFQAMPNDLGTGASAIHEMPDVSLFSRHLFGRVGWRVADEHGMHWHSFSPIDTSGVMAGMVGGGVGAYFFAVRQAHVHRPARGATAHPKPRVAPVPVEQNRKLVEVALCGSSVRQWRVRLQFYYQEHKAFPKSLDVVARKSDRPRMKTVPGTDKTYVYLGPAGKNGILLHGHPNGPDGKVTVLNTRLAVRRLTPEMLEKRLSSRQGR